MHQRSCMYGGISSIIQNTVSEAHLLYSLQPNKCLYPHACHLPVKSDPKARQRHRPRQSILQGTMVILSAAISIYFCPARISTLALFLCPQRPVAILHKPSSAVTGSEQRHLSIHQTLKQSKPSATKGGTANRRDSSTWMLLMSHF